MLKNPMKYSFNFSRIASVVLLFWLVTLSSAWAAPAAPAGLTAITGNGEASLSWNASAGSTWYLLYRGTASGGPYSFVAQTQGVSHSDHAPSNGSTYYYVVTALNASGQSPYSAEATVIPTASLLPAPTNVVVVAGNGQASLTWGPVTSAVAYNVYRSTTQGGPYTLLTPAAPGPSFTDTGLVNDTQYFYVVQTLSSNSGAWSDEVNVIPSALLPTAPTALTAAPGSTWARLAWSPSANATGYVVYRGTSVGGPYSFAGFSPTTGYEDFGRYNGTTYYYVVAAVNAKGRGAFSIEQSAAVSDIEMPHATVLTAELWGSGQISLSWNSAAGAVSYRLHRATAPGGPYTSLSIRTSGYTDSGLSNGTTYYYVVDANNASPTVARSNEVSLAPVTGGLPPAPGNIAAIPGNTQATFTWNPVPGATNHIVTVATSPGGPNIGGGYRSEATYTATGLTNGLTYYFRVQAYGGNWSAFSAEVNATPSETLPLAPTGLSITNGNTQLSLTWTAAADATGYQVYRRTKGNPWPLTPLGTSTGTLYTDNGVNNGTTYEYLVAAVNAGGAGAWSDNRSGTPATANQTLAPVNIAAIPGNTQATVTWNPVPGAASYYVRVAASPGGPYISGGSSSGPGYTATGLTNTVTYYFRVEAWGGTYSAFSAEVSATPSATLPLAPSGLGITGGNSQLSLTWTAVTGATSYQVYRRTGENPWLTPIGTSTGTLYTDSGLSNGTTYQYLVAAVKAAGAGAWSDSRSGTPADNRTTAPVNVAVIAGYTQATVTWDPVPGVSTYYVTVATAPGGTGSFSGYQSGPSYTVTGLTNGQTYYFRVQTTTAGNWSAYSAEVSATPSSSRLLAPTGLNITSGNHKLTLTWTAIEGAMEYKIYRRTNGTVFALIGSSLANAYTDTGLTKDMRYYYVVESVNLDGPGAWSNEVSSIPLDLPLYSLTTLLNGSGSINNLAQPPAFSCDTASCTASFDSGTAFTLRATPSSFYTFAGWSGGCSGTGDCILTLTANATVTATFIRMPLVQVISDPTPYYGLQSAYDGTSVNAVFNARNTTFSEDLTLNKSINVILNGGLDTDFMTVNDCTYIHGILRVKSGKLTVKRLIIR